MHRPAQYPDLPPHRRDVWDWVQIVGFCLLTAGVVVLVYFAVTVGGR